MPNSLDAIFRPRSVAVVGASRRAESIGTSIVRNLFRSGFSGMIFPVNREAHVIHSVKAYSTVSAIPDPVDLAVIVVPRSHVRETVEDCAKKGVKGLVVITAGFRETGAAGLADEEWLRQFCREKGMRLVGPNCMGVINAEPEFALDATFAPVGADFGSVAFASQSGAMGVAILNSCKRLGIGFTQFVSMGNKADVSGNDLLEYWENDPRTRLIAFYLEGLGNPARFQEIVRRVTKKKPVLMVKSGRSRVGARAASSHTGSAAGGDTAISALIDQCGVLRCDTLEELFDVAAAFTRCPLPAGRRIAIVSNAGGPAIMAADAAEALGLFINPLSDAAKARLRTFLPAEASVQNPVDMIASAKTENYVRTLEVVLAEESVDAVIVISVPPVLFDPTELMKRVTEVTRTAKKPVLTVFMAKEEFYETVHEIPDHPPVYRFPENALRALADMCRHATWCARPVEPTVTFDDVDDAEVRRVIAARKAPWLDAEELRRVLAAYRLPVPAQRTGRNLAEVLAAAKVVGFPCVLKAMGEKLVHKSDVGGVALGIESEGDLKAAFAGMQSALDKAGVLRHAEAYLVQQQVAAGREVIVGAFRDAKVGPVLAFGMGGRYVEALKDMAFRLPPLTRSDAVDITTSIRGTKILTGIRGEASVDHARLEDIVLRVGQLVSRHREIAELDLNPVIAHPVGTPTLVADARIRIE